MTRQNVTEGVREIMSRPCPTCEGEGVIKSEETIAIEFERRLRDVAAEHPDAEALLVQMNPRVSTQFTGHGSRVLHALEAQTGKSFLFEGSEGLTLDHFAITFAGTREEVEERALPFRQGDEVLVEIVEPHMYDVDDAVAKIDGYIISIAGAGAARGREADGAHRPGRAHRRQRAAAGRGRRGRHARAAPAGARDANAPARRRPGPPPKPTRDGRRAERRQARAATDRARAGRGTTTDRDAAGAAARGGAGARLGSRRRAARMAYNPSLGVVAAGAGGAVRLPRPRPRAAEPAGHGSHRKGSG